jgi:hypothetical protein
MRHHRDAIETPGLAAGRQGIGKHGTGELHAFMRRE